MLMYSTLDSINKYIMTNAELRDLSQCFYEVIHRLTFAEHENLCTAVISVVAVCPIGKCY